jgi:hypothetical protein
VTETQILYAICLIALLGVDLLTKATQASFENASLARVLGQGDASLPRIHRTLTLWRNRSACMPAPNLFLPVHFSSLFSGFDSP